MQDERKIKNYTRIVLDKDDLARIRTEQAGIRTIQATSRTYAAWVRTGFSIVSAGTALGQLLRSSPYSLLANLIAFALITIGLFSFIIGWFSYHSQYKALMKNPFMPKDLRDMFDADQKTISILTGALLFISIAAYLLLFVS